MFQLSPWSIQNVFRIATTLYGPSKPIYSPIADMCFQIISQNDPKNFSSKKDLIKWTFLFLSQTSLTAMLNMCLRPIPLPSKTHSITSNNCSFGCPIIYTDTNSRIGKRCLAIIASNVICHITKHFRVCVTANQ